jgi:hypothetical protein
VNNVPINNTGQLMNGDIGPCATRTKYVPGKTDLFVGEDNFRLKPTSPYSASCARRCDFKGTDGKDLGADIDEIEASTSGAIGGAPSWIDQAAIAVTTTSTAATLEYKASDDSACTLRLYTNAARTALHSERQDAGGRDARRTIRLGTGPQLKPKTDYWYLLICRDRRIPGRFRIQ